MRRAPIVAIAVALAAGCVAMACGSEVGTPGWQGTPVDGGPRPIDFDGAYPSADPDPDSDSGSGASPSFGDAGAGSFVCTGRSLGAGDRAVTLSSGGISRLFYVHVPPAYDPARGATLVLDFHGFTNTALEQRVLSRMDASSDAHGYLSVYPAGIATSWNAGDCCGTAWTNAVDDVAFVKAMVARLKADYCVDPKRVYATGYSNGGFLSYRLACDLADTFAAIGSVAGQMGESGAACKPSRPVPVLDFHGTSDPIVPYNGGSPVVPLAMPGALNFRSTAETLQIWREKNGCLGAGSIIFQQGDATCIRYDVCAAGADVVHCKIDKGGHTWPGGVPIPIVGKTSTDINATETLYQFFAAHPMP